MRYYNRQPINGKAPTSNSFAVEIDGRISTNTRKSIEIPAGPTEDRPDNPVNGMIRYNTSIDQFESYINGVWQLLIANTQAEVIQQIFENGDYADTIFGPLAYDIDLNKPQSIMVYVENVPQIATINYQLVYGSQSVPYTTSTTVAALAPVNTTTLTLTSVADFNAGFAVGATGIDSGTTIVSSSGTDLTITLSSPTSSEITSGTGITVFYTSGTYVKFSSNSVPVPNTPVITLVGFDGYSPNIVP